MGKMVWLREFLTNSGSVLLRSERPRDAEDRKLLTESIGDSLLLHHEGSVLNQSYIDCCHLPVSKLTLQGDEKMMAAIFESASSVPLPQKDDGPVKAQEGQAKGFFSAFVRVYDTGAEDMDVKTTYVYTMHWPVALTERSYLTTCDPFEFLSMPTKADLTAALESFIPQIVDDGRDPMEAASSEFFQAVKASKWYTPGQLVAWLLLTSRLMLKALAYRLYVQNCQ